jgi:protein SCO1/2
VGRVAQAAGYRYLFDPRIGQYAHDPLVYALDRQGRVRAALSEFALQPADLRAALTGAPTRAASAFDQIRLVCHGLVAEVGRWNGPVRAALRIGALALLALAGGAALTLARRRRA